jgi:predicted RND superfamily exporter protein
MWNPDRLAERYVTWLRRRSLAVIVASAAILVASIYVVAFHLPLFADFSYLLPQDTPGVRDLRRMEKRTNYKDTALVIVVSPDPQVQAAATAEMIAGLRTVDADLIERLDTDDAESRSFFRQHRHLFVPVEDLRAARDAIRRRIDEVKLAANPLFIDLDEEEDAAARKDRTQLEALRKRRAEAEARLSRSGYVSPDGTTALITVRTAFGRTDAQSGAALMANMSAIRDQVRARHPDVTIGFTGGVPEALAEHEALVKGMVLSSLVTAGLVALVLILFFRSATLLTLLTATLVVGTTTAFGVAAFTVGHLNAATGFLGAMVAGNGVNYGILLIARFLEERRRADGQRALAVAIRTTLRPTIVASLGAAIAYGSLAATSFRGFADFAIIGAVGMVLCWLASYLLLPALLLRFGQNTRIFEGNPVLGGILARLFGFKRPAVVCFLAAVTAVAAGAIVVRYIAADPFEYDITRLRSEGDDATAVRRWMKVSNEAFGRGISGKTFVAADRAEQVPLIVSALRKKDAALPTDQRVLGSVTSILDVIPPDQEQRIALLTELRTLLSEDVLAEFEAKERAEISDLRPPADLAPITVADLPEEIARQLRERDGRVGYMITTRPSPSVNEWDGRDLIRYATVVRSLTLDNGEVITTSGSHVIFADIITSIERDGPRVTLVAIVGLILMVVVVVGRNLRALAVISATMLGSVAMIAVCALAGIKVNFLDFVALPITLGLGIDYAINIAHRTHQEKEFDPISTLRTSGSAVFLCSLTTIIGYGSLLVSENLAIRGFGLASLIGEVTCLVASLAVVPAIVLLGARRRSSNVSDRAPTASAA